MTPAMFLAVFLFFIGTCNVAADTDFCPPGFIQHQSSCYLFSILRLPWIQAMKICTVYGAELAVIESEEEELFIENYLKTTWSTYNHTDGIWLGGTDLLVENEWIWAVSQDPISYFRWGPGEPNIHGGSFSEDCLDLLPHKAFEWNDENCGKKLNFLCERSIFKDYVPPSIVG